MKIDEQLIECLNRYSSPIQPLGDNLRIIIERSESIKENIVPVLGMQGMGKSTIINGLLKADILPNDADETTCVPVEVAYGDREYGEVIYNDKKKATRIVHTREELNQYVDNNENHANEKGVERIRLYRKADILKTGVTIVDLPGVGSVTLENEKTTQRYIQNVAMAIFVIPTIPTIRGMEETFIQGAWAQFSRAMFVQNEWNDTKEEIKDSVDYNTKILQQIAEKIGSRFEGPIIVVNAFDAVEGALKNDNQLIQKSNIKNLEKKIISFSSKWESQKSADLKERIINIIQAALNIASKKLEDAKKSEEDRIKENRALFEKYKASAEDIINAISKIEDWLNYQEPKLRNELNKEVATTVGDIRAQMYNIIDGGTFDGEKLEKAFNNVQSLHIQNFFDKAVETLREFAISFQSQMAELEDKLEVQNDFLFSPEQHSSKGAFKWEKGLGVGGGIGGLIAANAWAAPLTAFFVSNPAGWVVMAVGVVITGIVTAIAYLFKKGVKDMRANNAKKQINEPIDKIEQKLRSQIQSKVNEIIAQSQKILKDLKEAQEEQIRVMRRELHRGVTNNNTGIIELDIQYLTNIKTSLSDVNQ